MSTTSPSSTRQPTITSTRAAAPARAADAQRTPKDAQLRGTQQARPSLFAEVLGRGAQTKGKPASPMHAGAALGAQKSAHPQSTALAQQQSAAQRLGAPRPQNEGRDAKPHITRAGHDDGDRTLLAPFVPPPSVLAAPLSTTPIAAPAASSAPARAEAAALAERLVRSMRIGKVGRDGHEVRLRLDVGARGDVEVRLRHVDGALSATLVTDAASHADAERLATALRQELADRGIVCENIDVAIG